MMQKLLRTLGFKVTAFDISPTAIAWAKQRFPNSSVNYLVAELLALDSDWNGAFDLVFECQTIQSLPLNLREKVMSAIAPLLAPGGTLLLIARQRDFDAEPDAPLGHYRRKKSPSFRIWDYQKLAVIPSWKVIIIILNRCELNIC
jgi:2-polyprenyl-3-methyl-5-hydroxy-6-metoxy-1,4-benzoquinol methylase